MSAVIVKTATGTYTLVDVRRVFENFEADLRMIVRRTGTNTQDWAEKTAADVLLFAGGDYLSQVSVVLFDRWGNRKAMKWYQVDKAAGEWESDLPGGNRWPRLDSPSLSVVVHLNARWYAESAAAQSAVSSQQNHTWVDSSVDTSDRGMVRKGSRRYGSNAYGLNAIDFRSV